MSASIEDLAVGFIEAFNARNADAIVVVCDPEIVWRPTLLVGAKRTYSGHEGMRRWVEDLAHAAVQHRSQITSVCALANDRFAIFADLATGAAHDTPAAMVARIGASGLIVEADGYLSDAELLRRLGVLD